MEPATGSAFLSALARRRLPSARWRASSCVQCQQAAGGRGRLLRGLRGYFPPARLSFSHRRRRVVTDLGEHVVVGFAAEADLQAAAVGAVFLAVAGASLALGRGFDRSERLRRGVGSRSFDVARASSLLSRVFGRRASVRLAGRYFRSRHLRARFAWCHKYLHLAGGTEGRVAEPQNRAIAET